MSVAFRCDRCHGYFDPTFMILEDAEFLKFMRMVKKEGERSNEVDYDSTNDKKQYRFGNYTITCDSAGHCDDFNCIFGDVCPGNDNARPNKTPKRSSSSEEDSPGRSEV